MLKACDRPCTSGLLMACALAAWLQPWSARAAAADLDALDLKAEPEQPVPADKSSTRWFFEAAAGRISQRYGLESESSSRVSADFFFSRPLAQGWRV
ncbi:MAG TPA: hypothetical protein VD932_07655, partial [Aquabacterium sp.]|nr:hypothetical protein [Aquabacterium sp.]